MLAFKSMHFLTGEELSKKELLQTIEQADLMSQRRGGTRAPNADLLRGKVIALMFEKPSLRTRVSFTVGAQELGGQVIELLGSQTKSEEPEDSIRVLQGMVHGLMLRTFDHRKLERMLPVARIPVINGLSDSHHPCQALADLLTLHQSFGGLQGLTLAYVGDGNNVLHSLLLLAPFLGVNVHFACPSGYQPSTEILDRALARAHQGGGSIRAFRSANEAVRGVQALYTDVWTSMGRESENAKRLADFAGYQLTVERLQLADPTAVVMHCLPMVKGQEITADLVEHPRCRIFQQSENRLHAQKALMVGLFKCAANVQTATPRMELSHVV